MNIDYLLVDDEEEAKHKENESIWQKIVTAVDTKDDEPEPKSYVVNVVSSLGIPVQCKVIYKDEDILTIQLIDSQMYDC
jgi:hypothetical protein